MSRPSWDVWFLRIAMVVAERASCKRLKVGAVLVKNNHVIASGYNGAPSGQPQCIDVDCEVEDGHCQRAVHAELNVIANAARHGGGSEGATLYVTHSPCYACAKVLINAGIRKVVFNTDYRKDERVWTMLRSAGLHVGRVNAEVRVDDAGERMTSYVPPGSD